jgi:hypothetical protein
MVHRKLLHMEKTFIFLHKLSFRVLRFEWDELPIGHMGTFEIFVRDKHVHMSTFNDKNSHREMHQLNVSLSDDCAANSSKIFRVLYFRVLLLRLLGKLIINRKFLVLTHKKKHVPLSLTINLYHKYTSHVLHKCSNHYLLSQKAPLKECLCMWLF